MKKRVFLTGATGYIGRHVLEHLLQNGHSVTALVRPRQGMAHERLGANLLAFPGLEVLAGDVSKPNCGLSEIESQLLKNRVDAVVHCAGLTDFEPRRAHELLLANLTGTENVFTLAREMGALHFHHVSTAFVAGNTPSVFTETDFDQGQSFKNPYERSKFEAEKFLRSQRGQGPTVCIYRPSIVVGGRVLGEDGSVGTLYAYLKAMRFVRECFEKDAASTGRLAKKYQAHKKDGVWHIPLRIEADARTRLNLVHIEDVAQRLGLGVENSPAKHETQLLTPDGSFSLEEIRHIFCQELRTEEVELVFHASFRANPANGLEEKFERMTAVFKPYLFHSAVFKADKSLKTVSLKNVAREFLSELDAQEAAHAGGRLGRMAVGCQNVEKADNYLDQFAQGRFGSSLLKRMGFAQATVGFRVRGAQEVSRTIFFDKGSVRPATQEPAEAPDFVYELDEACFRRIVTGGLDPREAFFKGALKISGNQEMALKFGFTFTEHFLNIDHRILEELEGAAS